MKKKNLIIVIKFICKYVLPVIIGWLEGDSHALQDIVSNL